MATLLRFQRAIASSFQCRPQLPYQTRPYSLTLRAIHPTRHLSVSCGSTFKQRPSVILQLLKTKQHVVQSPSILRHTRQFFTSLKHQQRHFVQPKPPRSSFWDKIPEDFLFYGIIGLNAGVFVMWYLSNQQLVRIKSIIHHTE